MPRERRTWRRRALLLAGAIALALLLAEGAVRLHAALFFPRTMMLDRTLGWRRVPDVQRRYDNEDGSHCEFTTNRHGLRGPARPKAKTAGRRRVLVLGDSFTEGGQIDDADLFTARVEAALGDVEVVNAGVGGYGTVQEYLYLREEGLGFAPDLVVVVFYDNDLIDNCLPYSPAIGPRPYAERTDVGVRIVEDYSDDGFLGFCLPLPGRSFLSRHSYVYRSLNDKLFQTLWARTLHDRAEADHRRFDPETRRTILWDVLQRMRALADSGGARFALVLAPTREQVEAGAAAELAFLEERCGAAGIPCLSLLPALREAAQSGTAQYFPRDIHWTRAGHATVARALEPFVRAPLR
jgi:hypothetical protein